MLIFNKFTIDVRLVLLIICVWILVFLMGCSTAPWDKDEVSRLSEINEGKTVPIVLVEVD